MADKHLELFNQLSKLVRENEAFYITEQFKDGHSFFIFNYRLASYTAFCQPGALDARGTMFEVDLGGNFIRLACLPPPKFFNLNECSFTMNLDLTDATLVTSKLDGSLISSYHVDGELYLKTKGSLYSEQALAAMALIKTSKYKGLYEFVRNSTINGHTINFEYCSPVNRIVVNYEKSFLKIISIRDPNGIYWDYSVIAEMLKQLDRGDFLIQNEVEESGKYCNGKHDITDFIKSVLTLTGIEGFVVYLKDGTVFKIKTTWYCNLHYTKDSVNNPRRLFECTVNETSDDLRALFFDDAIALKLIGEMEQKVSKLYNGMVNTVDSFYHQNKEKDRKSYAILAKATVDQLYFGLAMNRYIGREINWKEFMIKNYKYL